VGKKRMKKKIKIKKYAMGNERCGAVVVVVVVAVGLDRAVAVHFPLLRLAVKVTRRPREERQSTGKWKRKRGRYTTQTHDSAHKQADRLNTI
jgi:hypothetical protein